MISSAFENVKRLSDDQLRGTVEAARRGDMSAIEALNLTSATPVLAEMLRRNKIREMFQKNMSGASPNPQTVMDKVLAQADATKGVGSLETPGMMEEEAYAGGGIVSFSGGGGPGFIEEPPIEGSGMSDRQLLRTPEYYDEPQQTSDEITDAQWLRMSPAERLRYEKRLLSKSIDARRAALGQPVSELTPQEGTELFSERLKMLQDFTKPYNERMQKLVAEGRVDEGKRKEELGRSALNQAFLGMIGARKARGSGIGGSLANIAGAATGGIKAYEAGIAKLEEAKRLQNRAEMDAIKAESALEKGNFAEARKYVDDMIDARRNAARSYTQSQRLLGVEEKTGIESLDREYRAGLVAEEARRRTEAREEADRKEREARAKGEWNPRGGGAGGPRPMTEGQYLASIAREEKAIRENPTRMAGLRKIHGRGEALDDAIYKLALDKVNKSASERTGKPAPKSSEKSSGKPSATLPEGAVSIPLLP